MRRSRLLLLTLLPTGWALSMLATLNFELHPVAVFANPTFVAVSIAALLFRASPELEGVIIIVFNFAFWLPVAHLIDRVLEKRRRGSRSSASG